MHNPMPSWRRILFKIILWLIMICIPLSLSASIWAQRSYNFSCLNMMLRLVLMWVVESHIWSLSFDFSCWKNDSGTEIRFHSMSRLSSTHTINRFTGFFHDMFQILLVLDMNLRLMNFLVFIFHFEIYFDYR